MRKMFRAMADNLSAITQELRSAALEQPEETASKPKARRNSKKKPAKETQASEIAEEKKNAA